MAGFLDQFRSRVISTVWKDSPPQQPPNIDDKIALGVLLWIVAQADGKFLPQEEQQIKEMLVSQCHVSKEEMPYVVSSIAQAAEERIDLYRFTHEVSKDLQYNVKVGIIENLFRVACADGDIDHNEIETIRKISGLFGVDHKEFIEAKIKIKEEFHLNSD